MLEQRMNSQGKLSRRSFLLLQGPQSLFFKRLAQGLRRQGACVHKVNFCGGDVLLWGCQASDWYRGDIYQWVSWIAQAYRKYAVTDICLYGDWRPMHWEAIRLAHVRGIRVWVYEEGYLRGKYSTLEENGVNGRSRLPRISQLVREAAKKLPQRQDSGLEVVNSIRDKVFSAVVHHFGNALLYAVFFRYRTHRPTNIAFELPYILRRYLGRKKRSVRDNEKMQAFGRQHKKYFFFPLQLNSDSQIQLYSPYVRMQEVIADVITSFAIKANKDTALLIKNHPLDNGMICYRRFIENFAKELGVAERVVFVDGGALDEMISNCSGVVVVNSTVGLRALELNKPVYCLGWAVYNMAGLTQSWPMVSLDDFWTDPKKPDASLLSDFEKILEHQASVRGNFYSEPAIDLAVNDSLYRFAQNDQRAMRGGQHD